MKVLAFLLLAVLASASAKRFVCYYGSWSVYRKGMGNYTVEDIDPHVCTHLIYTFIGVSYEGEAHLLDSYNDVGDDWHEGAFIKLQRTMAANPDLKVMLAVGGWNHGPGTFQETVRHPEKRQKFIQTSIELIKKYNFHGLDLDWEYQDSVGGTPEDKDGFSQLLREMYAAFHQNNLILSSAVQANVNLIDADYDVPVLSDNLDFINVMCYDLHGGWEHYTGHVSPLHALSTEEGYDRNLNVEFIIKRFIERGADPQKINIGLVLYGRSFTLVDPNDHDLYSPASGTGEMGEWVPEAGILAYGELCLQFNQNLWTIYRNEEQGIPYAVKGNQWVGFDDEEALAKKLAFAKSLNLGGAMIWSVETDDHKGNCGKGKNPILTYISNNL